MCLTYLDKDHVTGEDPIEHIFIRNLPKSGIYISYNCFNIKLLNFISK